MSPPSDGLAKKYPNIKFLKMLRDPRDVIVSAATYLARLPIEQGGWGKFSGLSEKEKILTLIRDGNFLLEELREWFLCSFALSVRYEDLLVDGIGELGKIVSFLGYSISEDVLEFYFQKYSFNNMTGRNAGQEDQNSFFRKGIAGDWKNKFDAEIIHSFKTARDGEWQALLELLEYEQDADWTCKKE